MSDSNPTPSHWFLRLVRRGRYAAAARARWSNPATRDKLTRWHSRRWSDSYKRTHSKATRDKLSALATAQHAQRLAPLRGPHGLGLVMPPADLRTLPVQRYESVVIPLHPTGPVADGLWELAKLVTRARETEHLVVEPLGSTRLYLHGWRSIRKGAGTDKGSVRLLSNRTWEVDGGRLHITTGDGVKRTVPVMVVERHN